MRRKCWLGWEGCSLVLSLVTLLVAPSALEARASSGPPVVVEPVEGQDAGGRDEDRAPVCDNAALKEVFDLISTACRTGECDPKILAQLDSRVNRGQLLGILRNRELSGVHLFFPSNRDEVTNIFDWTVSKSQQLESLRYAVSRPEETVVYVVGKASTTGTFEHNRQLSRERARSVGAWIQSNIRLPFHHIHYAWTGEEYLQFNFSDARSLNLEPQDFRSDDLILNQAVHVFIYPCAPPMGSEHAH